MNLPNPRRSIALNDILKISDLTKTKIRMVVMSQGNWNPVDFFKRQSPKPLFDSLLWNYSKGLYAVADIALGMVRFDRREHLWLLFAAVQITEDLKVRNGVGYKCKQLEDLSPYLGRLVIKYKNSSQNLVRKASGIIDSCEVAQILPDQYCDDEFPGYDSLRVEWADLTRLLARLDWKVSLQNQKAVYLITDSSNGKQYVGSACGQDMLLGRWSSYARSGHGGNVQFKKLPLDHIRKHFIYSILDVFKASTDDKLIMERENWWKITLKTREFGYNAN